MLRLLLFVVSLSAFCHAGWIVNPGPKYPPTKGDVWPKPQVENKELRYFLFNPSQFKFKETVKTCPLLKTALDRYVYALSRQHSVVRKTRRHHQHHKKTDKRHVEERQSFDNLPHSTVTPKDAYFKGAIKELAVTLTQPCEEYPHYEMDEACKAVREIHNLTISSNSELKSDSIWGIIRGLETFSQSFYATDQRAPGYWLHTGATRARDASATDDFNEVRVNYTQIIDYPRFAHRGLLLDTSRHYVTVHNILTTLDAMSMNKLNVFHWHIVDDQSFPYQSEKFPQLSAQGAYHSSMVYTKDDIKTVVEYARVRGIRVLPEFDVPGHTRSWGVAFPTLLTECYKDSEIVGLGPMNPLKNATYKLLRELFSEVQEWFPERYFHIGGDEVDLDCWSSNPEIVDYMKKNNCTVTKLHAIFMEKAIPLLANGTSAIVWQEVFDENVPLSPKTLVQVWKSYPTSEMIRVLKAGYKLLFSSSWYLDHLSSGGDWEKMYDADPRELVGDPVLAAGVVGGEACMWGEVVDDRNVISRVWPRTSAVAERLWSSPANTPQTTFSKDVWNRIEEHTCRMIRQGVNAQPPNGPGFCLSG